MARPAFTPTEEQRQKVKCMGGWGMKQEHIAKIIGVRSPKTLRKHFRQELDRGEAEAHAKVNQTLYKMAISGNNPGATIFFLKRGGLRERSDLPATQAVPPPFEVYVEKKGDGETQT